MHKFFLILISFCFVFFGVVFTLGFAVAEDELFTIHNVRVKVTSENSINAQTIAQDKGLRKAFERLYKKIVVDKYWKYLSSSSKSSDAGSVYKDQKNFVENSVNLSSPNHHSPKYLYVSKSILRALSQEMQIISEKRSQKSFSASFTFRFKKNKVIELLRKYNIPYTTKSSPLRLVLPILKYQDKEYLWEDNNPWFSALASQKHENELVPFFVPKSPNSDANMLSIEEISNLDQGALSNMAVKYNVKAIDVFYASLQRNGKNNNLNISVFTVFDKYDKSVIGKKKLSVFAKTADDNFFNAASLAIKRIISLEQEKWKAKNIIYIKNTNIYTINSKYISMEAWQKIKSYLKSSNIVKKFQLKSLSVSEASLLISINGNKNDLKSDLRLNDLGLYEDDNGLFIQ